MPELWFFHHIFFFFSGNWNDGQQDDKHSAWVRSDGKSDVINIFHRLIRPSHPYSCGSAFTSVHAQQRVSRSGVCFLCEKPLVKSVCPTDIESSTKKSGSLIFKECSCDTQRKLCTECTAEHSLDLCVHLLGTPHPPTPSVDPAAE